MMRLKQGKVGGMQYSAVAIIGHADDFGELSSGALMYMVTLPYRTQVHLLGIPKATRVAQLKPDSRGSLMEKVILEGDYPNYFSLYTEKGMQTDVRYALDPKAMLFTIDFCQSHSWEIADGYLYFVQGNTPQYKDDPTYMFEDIERFVAEVRPVVSNGEINEDPYLKTAASLVIRPDILELDCPVCAQVMSAENDCYRCPQDHGILLVGAKLSRVRSGEIRNPGAVTKREQTHIKCPSCGSEMNHVQFGDLHTFIDSCSKCPYRWLDAGELHR